MYYIGIDVQVPADLDQIATSAALRPALDGSRYLAIAAGRARATKHRDPWGRQGRRATVNCAARSGSVSTEDIWKFLIWNRARPHRPLFL
jgi:hypothetical protein